VKMGTPGIGPSGGTLAGNETGAVVSPA
jgi:hypothetical protein